MENKCLIENFKLLPIEQIIPNPKNNNKHDQKQIDRLAKIIKVQGFRRPLTISKRTGFLVVGHARLEAAKKIGIKELPVIFQDYENEAMEYADLTADNAIASWSEIDLSMVNQEILELGPFDIELLGLQNFSVCAMIDDEKESDSEESENKKYILQVELPNELELRDLYDDLTSKGYMVKEL